MLRRRVVERNLFTRRDIPQREEQHVAVCDAAETVRVTRMINERCRVSADVRVDAPVPIDFADSHFATFRDAPFRLAIRDPFTNQFTDFLTTT